MDKIGIFQTQKFGQERAFFCVNLTSLMLHE